VVSVADLSFMASEMNGATTPDVTRWRDRENVVKVATECDRVVWRAGAVGVEKQTGLQPKTVFPWRRRKRMHRRKKKEIGDQKIDLENLRDLETVFPSTLG